VLEDSGVRPALFRRSKAFLHHLQPLKLKQTSLLLVIIVSIIISESRQAKTLFFCKSFLIFLKLPYKLYTWYIPYELLKALLHYLQLLYNIKHSIRIQKICRFAQDASIYKKELGVRM
jgi:hypothetical protein